VSEHVVHLSGDPGPLVRPRLGDPELLLGLGALGIATGTRAQNAVTTVLAPIQLRDPTGLTSLLPVGDTFRFYSVTGGVPTRDASTYRLAISGLVDHPTSLTLADLRAMPQTSLVRDFQCVTGWRVHDVKWKGVLLSDLLDRGGVACAGPPSVVLDADVLERAFGARLWVGRHALTETPVVLPMPRVP